MNWLIPSSFLEISALRKLLSVLIFFNITMWLLQNWRARFFDPKYSDLGKILIYNFSKRISLTMRISKTQQNNSFYIRIADIVVSFYDKLRGNNPSLKAWFIWEIMKQKRKLVLKILNHKHRTIKISMSYFCHFF